MDSDRTGIRKTITLRELAGVFLRAADPRTVRLRDPPRRPRGSIAIAVAAGALAAGAAAIAAARAPAGPDETPPISFQATEDRSAEESMPDPPAPRDPAAPLAISARHPRFHHMFYVFTDLPPTRVTAYPLADPPGIVVDIEGVPEPEESPETLVGEDERIRSVRRRITPRGLRYVIGIRTPVTRLEVEHEGGVVIVTPVR